MTLHHILLIALIQGITEWLPISSSAHLAILPALTDLPDQGLMVDAAAHLGTLFAGMLWFRRDIAAASSGLAQLTRTKCKPESPEARLALCLLIATPPALLAGIAYELLDADQILRHLHIIAAANIGFGLILWIADRQGTQQRQMSNISNGDAVLIGLAQMLALIPGASRSGVTMSAARLLGLERSEAARFSILMGAPILAAAGGYSMLSLLRSPEAAMVSIQDAIVVMLCSFLAALAAIGALMTLLKHIGFAPFVLYRLVLGGALLVWMAG